jgi:hypothetical protein
LASQGCDNFLSILGSLLLENIAMDTIPDALIQEHQLRIDGLGRLAAS